LPHAWTARLEMPRTAWTCPPDRLKTAQTCWTLPSDLRCLDNLDNCRRRLGDAMPAWTLAGPRLDQRARRAWMRLDRLDMKDRLPASDLPG
jgi:hypothetical protein